MKLTDKSSNDSWVLYYDTEKGYTIEPNTIQSFDASVKNIQMEKAMQFTGFEFTFAILLAFLLGFLLGSFLGWHSGIKQVRASAVKEKLGEYDVDTDTGKIEFWWTGKPSK